MPPRTDPTERQKRLGYEVRQLRAAAGLTSDATAKLLRVDRSKISNIERGIRTISPDRLVALAEVCGCDDRDFIGELVRLARPSGGWWTRYRGSLSTGQLDIAEHEFHATSMRSAHCVHIPGLMQTAEHATAIFRMMVPAMSEQEVGLRLAFRMERQQVLVEDQGPHYEAIVHEAALRMRFGGTQTWRAQLVRLVELADHPRITLRIIPFSTDGFPGSGQTINYFHAPVSRLDTVQMDSSHGPLFLYSEDQQDRYRQLLDLMQTLALTPEDSQSFVEELSKTA